MSAVTAASSCVGPRRERLAHSYLELILGQLLLRERGLEHFDRLLAVGV